MLSSFCWFCIHLRGETGLKFDTRSLKSVSFRFRWYEYRFTFYWQKDFFGIFIASSRSQLGVIVWHVEGICNEILELLKRIFFPSLNFQNVSPSVEITQLWSRHCDTSSKLKIVSGSDFLIEKIKKVDSTVGNLIENEWWSGSRKWKISLQILSSANNRITIHQVSVVIRSGSSAREKKIEERKPGEKLKYKYR